ncbi:hypothetical protein BGE01nite_30870 [Brevifollis gellanilyticus]|uniref:Uncharacterized protein n=1 Tax=Brevifollis gellanilyticus TaxID=748831 RepID=A0A512MAN3_9BACT|nr:hypothetical protein BGE01nite_30870 [Brevifollis gellanilyticus]
MASSDTKLHDRVLLSVQRALVGEVTTQMRFIGVEFCPESIHLIVWHDGAMHESIIEDFDAGTVTQVVADFCWPERGDPQVSFEFVRCDYPQRPDFRGTLVYGRCEAAA